MVKFILKHVPDVSFWKSLSKRSYPTPKSYIYQNSFYYAAKSGIEEVVKALQDHGNLNINEHIPGSPSAIKTLIYEQDSIGVEILCKCGATFKSVRFERGLTAIQYLAQKQGSSKTLEVLLNHGANPNEAILYQSPLFMALSNRISENANVLLEHGADVNFVGYTAKSGPIPCFPDSVIKCPDLIPAFLKRGVDPNVTINGQPVLLYSMKNYDMAVIEAFVRAGADVNAKYDGKSMLEHCSSFYEFEPFLKGGVAAKDIERQCNISLLALAMESNMPRKLNTIIDLLSTGADPNLQPKGMDSLLISAVRKNEEDIVSALIAGGTNLDHVNCDGDMAIHVCCKQGSEFRSKQNIFDILVNADSPLSVSNSDGEYPLDILVKQIWSGNKENIGKAIVKLLEKGANPDTTYIDTNSSLMIAIENGLLVLAQSLIEAGANVTYRNKDNKNAFEFFSESYLSRQPDQGSQCDIIALSDQEETPEREIEKLEGQKVLLSFLTHGIEVNEETKSGVLPLHLAILLQDLNSVKWIIEHGGDANAVDTSFKTPLLNAVMMGLTDIVQILLTGNADPNYIYQDRKEEDSCHATCRTILTRMLKKSELPEKTLLELTKLLLSYGCDPNLENIGANSPLIYAVGMDYPAITKVLLDAKANVNHKGLYNLTALHFYFKTPHRRKPNIEELISDDSSDSTDVHKPNAILKLLIYFGASTESRSVDNDSPLHFALLRESCNHEDDILYLLQHSKNINVIGDEGSSPLVVAAIKGYFRMARKLVSMGSDVTHENENKDTVLHLCMDQKFDRETISLFLEKQANINAINASGETPLVRYIKREARKLYNLKLLRRQIRNTGKNDLVDNIKYLLKYGADPNAYGDGVDSPLMTATIHDMHGIISQMIDAKANVNYKRKDGKTALHLYMEKGFECKKLTRLTMRHQILDDKLTKQNIDKNIIEHLIEAGADVNIVDTIGQSPIYSLLENHDENIVDMILPSLITKESNVNCGEKVPLVLAATQSRIDAIRILLKAGANINQVDKTGNTALTAVLAKHNKNIPMEIVNVLIEAGASVNHMTTAGKTPLTLTLEFDSRWEMCDMVTVLLNSGAEKVDINLKGESGDFPLLMALERGQFETAMLMITAHPDAADIGNYKTKALERCLRLGLSDGLQILHLLTKDKKEHYQEDFVHAFLKWVISKQARLFNLLEKVTVKLLSNSNKYINIHEKYDDSPLTPLNSFINGVFKKSSAKGDFSAMNGLLPHVPNVNHVHCYKGNTVLHICWNGESMLVDEAVQFVTNFKKAGGCLMKKNEDGDYPLICVIKSKFPDAQIGKVVERFASEGALVISEKDECYPLHEAVALGLVSTVGVLLNSGVNPSRESQKGDLPLLLALKREKNRDDIVRLLIENGASLNSVSSTGQRPLDVYVNSLLRDKMNLQIAPNALASEDSELVITVDLTLFNKMIQGGSDLQPTKNMEEFVPHGYSDSALNVLITNGFLMATANLIKCGWKLQQEEWLPELDLQSLQLSQMCINNQWLERLDIDARMVAFYEVLIHALAKNKCVQTLGSYCLPVLREALQIASKGAEISSRIEDLPIPYRMKSFLNLENYLHVAEVFVVKKLEV